MLKEPITNYAGEPFFQRRSQLLLGGSSPSARPLVSERLQDASTALSDSRWAVEALTIIEEAQVRLWSADGRKAVAYLQGRGLAESTIKTARLGLSDGRRRGIVAGITIPWFENGSPLMLHVRRPEGSDPKYVASKGSRRGGLYPDPRVIRPGLPAVIVEGELDALLLGQELADVASVVTIGSASERPKASAQAALLVADPWYIATDAGDLAAECWPTHARRVRPPGKFKDWGQAREFRVNLRRWWLDVFAGNLSPSLFSWEELSAWRWEASDEEEESPGIIRE